MTEAGELESTPEVAQDAEPPVTAPKAMSPYATGSGGVTFERKVAVTYLAHLLVGDGAAELGHERRVVSIAFQQAPDHAVDDLVVTAARADEIEPSLVLALGARRAPDLVKSDESTQKLIRHFVRAVINAPADGPEHRFALVVAGPQRQAKQLAILADLAVAQMGPTEFFDLVRTPKKFSADVRGRLDQIEGLVKWALADLDVIDPATAHVQRRTWELLSRLTVLMPRLEAPDETDWATVVNSLIPVARGGDLDGASRLRDRLVALANEYPVNAATVDLTVLRRGAHSALDSSIRRNQQGWQALAHLNKQALSSVHHDITGADGSRRVHVDRRDVAAPVIASASTDTAVVVHGESGVGKSALVFRAATSAEAGDPGSPQVVCTNLRHLPGTTLEFEHLLGCPFSILLAELSAPQRLLVIDGADAVAEGMLEQLRYLVDAARSAHVGVIAITADDNKQVVLDTVSERFGADVVEHVVPGLTHAQVAEVVRTFKELANLAENPRSRELLRRPVVIDLFVRGAISGVPLSDADAMQQVWLGLVRRHEQSDRGTPDARDLAMLHLADLALSGGDPLEVVGVIDPAALEGLRRDGLLRKAVDDPFRIGPEFAHDEVRRYAVARLLLADTSPTAKLLKAGAPRWTLGATRLACQARLAAPNAAANPLRGRFARLQAAFDELVDVGHGERWGDVPSEALLTLGDPDPVLRDAWAELRAEKGRGLQRLVRLVDQRLRDARGLVRIVAVEPLVNLLLDDDTPWWSGEHVQDLLRDWLRAHVIANTTAGHPLRVRLRDLLVGACTAADRRLEEERVAFVAAMAARSREEVEEQRQLMERNRALFPEIGYPRSRRRQRPEVPREITDELVVELLALLGPDLGKDGEAILRRVGQDAPSELAPAVEGLFTGRALATYRGGFLAELTEAYYIDDEEDGSEFDDGIREHCNRSFGITPLAAWYRGPFLPLFQADFGSGVAVLNRMLNHAALVRARTLPSPNRGCRAPIDDSDIDEYRTEFDITGSRRVYVGDAHVWSWYRGRGVGPYPCISALQALEHVCDQFIEKGVPIPSIVATLLDGCENLAIVGFIVGLLVRHIECAYRLLDPYLVEPMIWRHEFGRAVNESTGLAAKSDGIVGAERRTWSMREAAMYLVVNADEARAAELRAIGEQLVENDRRLISGASNYGAGGGAAINDNAVVEEQLAPVRAWASGLDRDTYRTQRLDTGVYIQSTLPDDVVHALQSGKEDFHRRQEAMRLIGRYCIDTKDCMADDVPADELAADLSLARDLLDNPSDMSSWECWDMPTAVAGVALSAYLLRRVALNDDLLVFAVDTVLRFGTGEGSPRPFDYEETYFKQGADRSAARSLPLLLLPSAKPLLSRADGGYGSSTYDRVIAAGTNLARAVAHEVRTQLARSLDRVWQVPCTESRGCHHEVALQLALESMRDCAFGERDPNTGRRRTLLLDDPVEDALAETPDDAIYFSRLSAGMRALAPAAVAHICVSNRARAVLDVALAAQRRSLLAYDRDMDQRGTHALVVARALLTLAVNGDDAPIFQHIDVIAAAPRLIGSFLCALSSAAEEATERAATARRVWPEIVARVLELNESGHAPFNDRYFGDRTLAALLPNAAGEFSYLYRELDSDPIVWWEPLAWREVVERWLPVAVGNPTCVSHLINFLCALPVDDQVRHGLAWVATLVLADPERVAGHCDLLSAWLIETRSAAADTGLLAEWQRVVDALVVAGVGRLARYSE